MKCWNYRVSVLYEVFTDLERFARDPEEDEDSSDEMTPLRDGYDYPVYSTKVFIGGLPYGIDPGKGF